jgi:FAD/FMN-containing dehydrogenase
VRHDDLGAPEYEAVRRASVWQEIKPGRFPASIVTVDSAADAARAVRSAATSGRPVSVISSGHSYIGTGLRDGAVLLDVSRLREISIDPATMSATVGPGVTNGELEAVLERSDLAFPVGHSPSVAVGGYLLGGGLGWNSEAWGKAACFNVIGADVVLASGDVVHVGNRDHPELFWALRGAGPRFPALVTRYHVRLYERPSVILEMTASLPLDSVPDLTTWLLAILPAKSERIELSAMFVTQPGGSVTNTAERCIVSAVAFADDRETADRLLAPLAAGFPAPPGELAFRERTMASLLEDNDAAPQRYCVETVWSDDVATVLQTTARHFALAESPDSLVHISFRSAPAITDDAAYSVTGSALVFSSAVWDDEKDDVANFAWSDAFIDALAPVTVGHYINESEYLRHPERLDGCHTAEARERLRQVELQYDPASVFARIDREPNRLES